MDVGVGRGWLLEDEGVEALDCWSALSEEELD